MFFIICIFDTLHEETFFPEFYFPEDEDKFASKRRKRVTQ
jgi:hypothetical protein